MRGGGGAKGGTEKVRSFVSFFVGMASFRIDYVWEEASSHRIKVRMVMNVLGLCLGGGPVLTVHPGSRLGWTMSGM